MSTSHKGVFERDEDDKDGIKHRQGQYKLVERVCHLLCREDCDGEDVPQEAECSDHRLKTSFWNHAS